LGCRVNIEATRQPVSSSSSDSVRHDVLPVLSSQRGYFQHLISVDMTVILLCPIYHRLSLQCAQNTATRLVTNRRSHDCITLVLIDLHWLPVNLSTKYKRCLMIHLIHTQQCLDHMHDLVTLPQPVPDFVRLVVSPTRNLVSALSFGEHTFSHSVPVAWNSLPGYLQTATNTSSFERQLKTHVFTEVFKLFIKKVTFKVR